jgi:hypothetical protein
MPELYVARVKLMLNGGRLRVMPGQLVEFEAGDGMNIPRLIARGSVEPYESDEQVKRIADWWENEERRRREGVTRAAYELKHGGKHE